MHTITRNMKTNENADLLKLAFGEEGVDGTIVDTTILSPPPPQGGFTRGQSCFIGIGVLVLLVLWSLQKSIDYHEILRNDLRAKCTIMGLNTVTIIAVFVFLGRMQ